MTAIIKFDNSCKVVEEDNLEVLQALDKELSFHIQGSEFSKAYKGYLNDAGEFVSWDGHRHLLSSAGKFPAGLLPRVLEFFSQRKIPISIVDQRTPRRHFNEIDISGVLASMGHNPRPYQIDAAEIAVQNDRGIIRMATGAGKTLLAALITAKLGRSALICVIGKDLLYQIQALFKKIFGDEIGIIGDGKCEIKDINVATIWSICQALGVRKNISLDDSDDTEKKIDPSKFRNIKEMLLTTKTLILDECHLAACDSVQTISRNIKCENVYGLSASPWRDDGADLLIEAVLGQQIVDVSARELIRKGYLVEPNIRFLAPEPYKFKTGKYQNIYSKYIVENEQRNAMIVKAATRLVEQGFVPLVLFHSIKHGDILFDLLKKNVSTELLSGKDKSTTREKIKKDIENGQIKCICASKIFDIGIDLPILSGLIIAGAGKSSVRALQRIGRVIRPYPGKTMAAIVDFSDQAPYLNQHAEVRRKIYEWEFNVTWPELKKDNQES